MSDSATNRRNVLRTSGATLAALAGGSVLGTASACPGCGDTGSKPSVSTFGATVSGNEVTTNGYVSDLGDDDSADAWFEWGPYGGSLSNDTNIKYMYSTGGWCDGYDSSCFYNSYGTLSSGTYEYRAVASNTYGKSEGSIETFTI
jgi:subtilisin